MNYLQGLNKQQEIAVLHKEGPLLVLAGAGSGKTRVITCRIAHLIKHHNVKPWNILAITFTNKAAKEMKERVSLLLDENTRGMWIYTFHAACLNILRQHIHELGFDQNFLIFDTRDQLVLIKDCMQTLNINDKSFPPKNVLSAIGRAKDELIDYKEFAQLYASDFRMSKISKIYTMYQETLKKNNALDFDDIIMHTIKIFNKNKKILENYSRKFKYIMVDEYQDTNHAQFKLVSMLAKYHGNLCVVGDDDQSIYGWRGADISNILDFEKIFPECKTIKLEKNYRSTEVILKAANGVIKNNMGRKSKRLWTDESGGEKVINKKLENENQEAAFIVNTIEKNIDKGEDYSSFAILYRLNAQSRAIEDALTKKGIPYKIFGGIKFYDRKEIKDLLGYLRLLINTNDDVSFKRVVNEPKRGIGKKTLEKLGNAAEDKDISLFHAAEISDEIPGLQRKAKSLKQFTGLINDLKDMKETTVLSELVEIVIKSSGILETYKNDNSIEAESKIENINEFVTGVMDYESESPDDEQVTLEEYLFKVSLANDIDNLEEEQSYVTLMTLHSAKGLEFDRVFIPGFEEGVFPGYRSIGEEERIEEERRLCYVGFTRAKKNLYLTYVNSRTLFGKTNYNQVSRFFKEIPNKCVKIIADKKRKRPYGNRTKTKKQTGFFGSLTKGGKPVTLQDIKTSSKNKQSKTYKTGERVYHKKYGQGVVGSITGKGNDSKIEINFDKFGMKRFMLSMVKLKKVD